MAGAGRAPGEEGETCGGGGGFRRGFSHEVTGGRAHRVVLSRTGGVVDRVEGRFGAVGKSSAGSEG